MSDPKRPGRPPLVEGDTTTPVTVRLSTAMYDHACKVASDQRLKPTDVIRQAMIEGFRTRK